MHLVPPFSKHDPSCGPRKALRLFPVLFPSELTFIFPCRDVDLTSFPPFLLSVTYKKNFIPLTHTRKPLALNIQREIILRLNKRRILRKKNTSHCRLTRTPNSSETKAGPCCLQCDVVWWVEVWQTLTRMAVVFFIIRGSQEDQFPALYEGREGPCDWALAGRMHMKMCTSSFRLGGALPQFAFLSCWLAECRAPKWGALGRPYKVAGTQNGRHWIPQITTKATFL